MVNSSFSIWHFNFLKLHFSIKFPFFENEQGYKVRYQGCPLHYYANETYTPSSARPDPMFINKGTTSNFPAVPLTRNIIRIPYTL